MPNNHTPYTEEERLAIRAANYEKTQRWNEFSQGMKAYAAANRIPFKGTFELTPRCSMRCNMCYMRLDPPQMAAQGRELTAAEWIRMGEMAAQAGTLDLLLTGGEPMLRPDFPEIYRALTDMGFILRVYTNATLVTPEILSLFEERPPQQMEITLYGASPETYARVGGWAEGYTRATQAIDALRAIVPSICLKTTIVRDNAADFAAIKRFADERALPLKFNLLLLPAVRGATADVRACRLSVEEVLAFYAEHGIEDEAVECCPPEGEDRPALYCAAGLASFDVLWHGEMVACLMDDDPAAPRGYPLRDGFEAAWEAIRDFRCGRVLPEPCKTCAAYADCGTCAVQHYAETREPGRQAQHICDVNRIQRGLAPLSSHIIRGFEKKLAKNG